MIVCSHRGPYRFERAADGTFLAHRGGGGVVSALGPLVSGRADTTWIAAAMNADDREAVRAGAADGLDIRCDLLDLDPDAHRMHYDVIANGVLWFLFLGLFDRVRGRGFDIEFRDAWDAYNTVNHAFADAVAKIAPERDIVLVQDYQLVLVPGMLRSLRPDLRVVHFMHTPFCNADDIMVLPDDVASQVHGSLASGPAGFHTTRWADMYRNAARVVLPASAHVTPPFVAPLGPDVGALEEVARSDAARRAADDLADIVGDRLVVARVDRIEPSKNIVRGFLAYDRLLEARPGMRGRVVFAAMVYPSRAHMPEYAAYAEEVAATVARINDRWATRDWVPIVLDDRDHFERSVAGLQRYDVLLVNPLRDGLNLVAMEGPVLNRRDGVVCLSREAGAYELLGRAVEAIHPYDIEQGAFALDTALSMPLDERATRARRVRELASARTPSLWLADLVGHAGE
jgi:trehalose 6-phosphate synthase